MRKYYLLILFFSLTVFFGGCSSVNIRTDGAAETQQEPDYQKRFTYWWWGLKGEHSINVREICLKQKVEQLQAVSTFSDSLLTIVTLGIYQPRTARVWCQENHSTAHQNNTKGEKL